MKVLKRINNLVDDVKSGKFDISHIQTSPGSNGLINEGVIRQAAITMGYIVRRAEIKVRLMSVSGEIYDLAMQRLEYADRIYRERNEVQHA